MFLLNGRSQSQNSSFYSSPIKQNISPVNGLAFSSSSGSLHRNIFGGSSFFNMKPKLSKLSESLTNIEAVIHQMRMDTQSIRLKIQQLSDEYTTQKIGKKKDQIAKCIKLFKKEIAKKRKEEMFRWAELDKRIAENKKNSKDIKCKLTQIEDKVNKLENIMGFTVILQPKVPSFRIRR